MNARLTLIVAAMGASAQSASDPMLMIDGEGHTAQVQSLAFTPDGSRVISAGLDKLIRVWDTKSGELVRTIAGESTPGRGGVIYAIALSPDGRTLAAGGWLTGNPSQTRAIRLHDFRTGEVTGLLEGHGDVVEGLAFSPDGQYLASASADHTARIWDLGTRRTVKRLTGHKDRVHSVSFSPDGLVVTASLDKTLIVWNAKNGRPISTLAGHEGRLLSGAFGPGGSVVVSNSEDRSIRVWDPRSGQLLNTFSGFESGAGLALAGNRLLVAHTTGPRFPCDILSLSNGARLVRFDGHAGTITAVAVSPDGRVAATAGGPGNEILIWDIESGRALRRLSGPGRPAMRVGFGRDGRSIAFGWERLAAPQPNRYAALERVFWLRSPGGEEPMMGGRADESLYLGALDEAGPLRLGAPGAEAAEPVTLEISRGGRVERKLTRNQTSGYRHVSYTLTSDARYAVSGGLAGELTRYTPADGHEMKFSGHTGTVLSVAVSADSRTLVSGADDQTIRLWDIETGRNLLTIFAGDRLEWVAWTPDGYYAASPNGARYIGWFQNLGPTRLARVHRMEQMEAEFHRPAKVVERLRDRDSQLRLLTAESFEQLAPPSIRTNLGPEPTMAESSSFRLRIDKDPDSPPVTALRVFANGRVAPARATGGGWEADLPLSPGRNRVFVEASNGKSRTRGGGMVNAPASAIAAPPAGVLRVLAVGVSRYKDSSRSLKFPGKDASALAAALVKQPKSAFRDVDVKSLLDEAATRDGILTALRRTVKAATAEDTILVFLAGHGSLSGSTYYFWAWDHENDAPDRDVKWADLAAAIEASKARTILMVDTCHAAGAGGSLGSGAVSYDSLASVPGVYVFAASAGTELSREYDDLGHGIFTHAILESLKLPATDQDGLIYSDELAVRVRRIVSDRAGDEQHPVHFVFPRGMFATGLFQPVH